MRRCDGSRALVASRAVDGRCELGRRGEAVADAFVRALGYRVVARNFRCRAGEIDLIVLDGDTVVFVEVRSRTGTRLGTPLESVDGRKQTRVARVARYFLAAQGWYDRAARFDVVGVRFDRDPPSVEHVRAAFDVLG
ncbi:MAG: YraN family protein [Candidatus Binatia bacterium]